MTGGKENSKSGSDRFEHEYYIFPIYTSSSSWILMSQYVWRIIAAAGREKQTQNLLLHHFYGNLPNYVWQIVKTYQKPCMQNSADIFFTRPNKYFSYTRGFLLICKMIFY